MYSFLFVGNFNLHFKLPRMPPIHVSRNINKMLHSNKIDATIGSVDPTEDTFLNHPITQRGESLVGSTLTTVPTHSLQQLRLQTGSRFLTDGCKAFTTQRLSLSLNQIKRSFATTSGLLLKVLDNNWDTEMLKTDYDVERATRECAVLVKAADPAHSYQTGETLRAMLTRLAR